MKQVDTPAELKNNLPPSEEVSQRLTDWANEPTILNLKNDLMGAKPYHDIHVGKINHWNDLLHVRGAAKPKGRKGRSKVQPKVIRRQAEWRYSALTEPFLGSDKLFQVKSTTAGDMAAAQQNELILNYQWRTKFNRVKFIDDFVRATVDDGTCIVRVGWKRATTNVETLVPIYQHRNFQSQDEVQAFQQALQLSQQNPRSVEQMPPEMQQALDFYTESGQASVAVDTGQKQKTIVPQILENYPTAEVMNPQNVFIDPSCNGDITKALFIIATFETNKAELQKEGRYKNLDKIDWESNTPLSTPDHATTTPQEFQPEGSVRKKVVAYEYWGFWDIDGDGKKLTPFVATWIGATLIRLELNPFPDQKLPFVLVPYNPLKRELYGEPDAELLEDNQAIIGAVTRGMIDLLGRSANAQQGFAKGMLDPLNRRRYDNGEDYEYNPNQNPQQGIIEHKFPEIPQSAMGMLENQNQEAEALTGVKSFSGGMSGNAYGDVAAGVRGMLDAASKREMAILRRLAKGMTEIGVKFISMNGAFLSEKETVRITNDQFVQISREELKGDFDLEVDISTAEVDNAQAQDLAFMLQTMGPQMDPSISVNIVMAEIARLKRMPDLSKQLQNYKPQPDPMAEQMKQLQVEELKMKIAVLQSQKDLNEGRAQEAGAKTEKIGVETHLDATGIRHEQAMEQTQGQAEGNQNLEVTKALLKTHKQANGSETKPNVDAAIGWNHLSSTAGKMPVETTNQPVDNTFQRDELAHGGDAAYSLGSMHYNPELDPSADPGINMQ